MKRSGALGEAAPAGADLTERRSLFESLLDSAPDATLVIDSSGEIVLANRQVEHLFGYPSAELIGRRVEVLLPEDMRDSHVEHRANFAQDPYRREMGQGMDLEARRADGTLFPVEVSLSPMIDGDTQLVIASIRDVTERRRMAQQLARSNQDLQQFVYLASHDLQAPLRTVAGFTQVLVHSLGAASLTAEQRELVSNIEGGVVKMQLLIRDLLGYSRLDSRAKPPVSTLIDDVICAVANVLRDKIETAGGVLALDAPHHVMGDPEQLALVFANLIDNCLAHRGESAPEIVITSQRSDDGSMIEIWIADNGVGIPENKREDVFEPFKQLKVSGGTGMGLAVVKRVVERHGGNVGLHENAGGGTVVILTLPAAKRGSLKRSAPGLRVVVT